MPPNQEFGTDNSLLFWLLVGGSGSGEYVDSSVLIPLDGLQNQKVTSCSVFVVINWLQLSSIEKDTGNWPRHAVAVVAEEHVVVQLLHNLVHQQTLVVLLLLLKTLVEDCIKELLCGGLDLSCCLYFGLYDKIFYIFI